MNRENMLKVADAIEARQVSGHRVGFQMASYINPLASYDANGSICGTTACVAGFATLLHMDENNLKVSKGRYFDIQAHYIGTQYLGLTDSQAEALFVDSVNLFNENNPLVPDALRYMAATGRVAWKKAIEAAKCAKGQR